MRYNLLIPCVYALAGTAPSFAAESAPAAFPLTRYQTMMDQSPFALATEGPAAPAANVNPGFAKNLFLTGAVRLNRGEYVTISSREQNQSFALQTGNSYNGITLVSVAWSDAVGKTRATLKQGKEFATITFDEAALQAPASKAATDASSQAAAPTKSLLPAGIVPPNTNAQLRTKPAAPRR